MIRAGDVAVVTGAGRGIGRAVAAKLGALGVRVALLSRTPSDLEDAVAAVRAAGGEAHAFPCDVADAAQVDDTFARVQATLGPVDTLVNNAGVGTVAPVEVADYDVAEWDRIVGVNLRGAFLCARAVLPSMRERRRGAVVNVGSITGHASAPHVAPYGVSKFGLVGLTQALLAENHRHGIRVSLVSPGPTDSTIWDRKRVPLAPEVRAAMLRPDDVAEVVLFLLRLPETVRIDDVVVLPNTFPLKLWDYRVE